MKMVQPGTSKAGFVNKPSGCSASGNTSHRGPVEEENEEEEEG
jgi:hypothetical protein